MSMFASFLKRSVLGLRRILPAKAFRQLMQLGQRFGGQLLPAATLHSLENTARQSMRIASPAGGFSPGVRQHSVHIPENGWIGRAHPQSRTTCDMVICCAFQGRHDVLEEIIHESLSGQTAHTIYWVLTGSTDADRAFITRMAEESDGYVCGFVTHNKPLGQKWQSCVRGAWQAFDATLTAITGSDDVLSAHMLNALIERENRNLQHGVDPQFLPAIYATNEWLVIDIDPSSQLGGGIYHCGYKAGAQNQPIGAGRFYPRRMMEEVSGFLFDSRASRLLDDRGYFEVVSRGHHVDLYGAETGLLVSIKGSWAQMNHTSKLQTATSVTFRDDSFRASALLREQLSTRLQRYLGLI